MSERVVLITGGAGFIGSHVADELLAAGHSVRVLDNLSPQVHGEDCQRPAYLAPQVELIHGDVCDPQAVRRALKDVDRVLHLAAAVGVGQSMYQLRHYTHVNTVGTAVLLEALIEHRVRQLVVASSMSIYGEGLYADPDGRMHHQVRRSLDQMKAGDWEPRDTQQRQLTPLPTPETKAPDLASVYALTKYDQERLCLITGQAYDIPTTALRFFNVYGPRQALGNPYTGVLAIFAARLLNDQPPLIFEDGQQQRDFINVHDVARACRLALEQSAANGSAINIGTGMPRTVCEIAERLAAALDKRHIRPRIKGEYRMGDVRHCVADIACAKRLLDFEPTTDFDDGLIELTEWLRGQVAPNHVNDAHAELAARGLTL